MMSTCLEVQEIGYTNIPEVTNNVTYKQVLYNLLCKYKTLNQSVYLLLGLHHLLLSKLISLFTLLYLNKNLVSMQFFIYKLRRAYTQDGKREHSRRNYTKLRVLND